MRGTHTEQEETISSMTGSLDLRRGTYMLRTVQYPFDPSVSIGKEKPTFSKSLLVKIVTRGMYVIAIHEPKAHVLK